MKNIVIRVGEKNNFNQTNEEFQELKKFENKGSIFVNSNSFVEIKSIYPVILTINPYLVFTKPKGDFSKLSACRIKMFSTDIKNFNDEQYKALEWCKENNYKILVTFQRYRSEKSALKYSGENFRLNYTWKKSYFRINEKSKEKLLNNIKSLLGEKAYLLYICDSSGNGCPSCGNCHKLTYNLENAVIKALNLSISGIEDKHGKKGKCPFNCPDCFAKVVTYGKSPACDKLIYNKKITGDI